MGWSISITEEMRALGLAGNELIVFALINSCTMKSNGCYYGGTAFLCEVCGISRRTAFNTLDSLVGKGLIVKNEMYHNGIKYTSYQTSAESAQVVQKLHSGSAEIAPNNIDININNTLSIKARTRFVKPSVQEIADYCRERMNDVDADTFYNFYEAKGWVVGKSPMKDWKAAVRTWEKRLSSSQPQFRPAQKESVLSHNLKVMDQMFGTNLHQQAYGDGHGK